MTYKIIPMRPFGKARPRVTRNGTFMPPQYEADKQTLRLLFGDAPDYEMVSLDVVAIRAMPKSWSKAKRDEMNGQYCTTKPDIDNIAGAIMDALFADDSKVISLGISKLWGIDDALCIEISEYTNEVIR